MGHFLATMNPEAAARIDDGPSPPDIGTVVVYMARAGLQRMGRREFPAVVLGADTEGHLELFVMMEPEDMMMESHVRFRDQGQEGHCWRYVEQEITPEVDSLLEQIEAMRSEAKAVVSELRLSIAAIAADLAQLRYSVLGDYKPAKLSVYELLAEFESKLKKG